MQTCPPEFEDLLSRAGRRVLAGGAPALAGVLADPRTRFVARADLIDRRQAAALRALLDRALWPHLSLLAAPIPPETIWHQQESYADLLPKVMRQRTAYLERRGGKAWAAAESIGLLRLLRSASFRAFAALLAGAKLRARHGVQVLCYGPGDYAGPHHDHHPDIPAASQGYVDVHVTLSSPGARQSLVYAQGGHFSQVVEVAVPAGLTAYRLPFWHYTTPLAAAPGARQPRRWVLLGTFLYSGANPARGMLPPSSFTARA